MLEKGHRNRSVGQTDLNLHSSRSHCLLTVHVEGYGQGGHGVGLPANWHIARGSGLL